MELPLLYRTPQHWATQVLEKPLALLSDHAHLERKAATNAMDLLQRWPDDTPPEFWVERLCSIARDEAQHLKSVTDLLHQRGGTLSKMHRNPYVTGLRHWVRMGQGPLELLDRLLVSALIEIRSYERFTLLAQNNPDAKLARFYHQLETSEWGHHQVFLQLAQIVCPKEVYQARWELFLKNEAALMKEQPPGPRIHSGMIISNTKELL